MQPKLFVATKAFIVHNEKILILRESHKYDEGTQIGLLDIPGGRLKPGEQLGESLLREVKEETGLTVRIGKSFFVNEVFREVKGERWQIVRVFFECFSDSDQVKLSSDHDHFEWIAPQDFKKYPVIDNLFPAFDAYLEKR